MFQSRSDMREGQPPKVLQARPGIKDVGTRKARHKGSLLKTGRPTTMKAASLVCGATGIVFHDRSARREPGAACMLHREKGASLSRGEGPFAPIVVGTMR